MARHVREGQGLYPIQVTSSSWNEDLENVQSYIVKPVESFRPTLLCLECFDSEAPTWDPLFPRLWSWAVFALEPESQSIKPAATLAHI